MQRVTIEAQPIVKYRTGIGRYVFCLLKAFSLINLNDIDIRAFYFNFRRNFKDRHIFKGNVKSREINLFPGFLPYTLWKHIDFPPVEWFSGKSDLFHFTNFTLLPVKKGKKIITFHDAAIKRFPETMEDKNRKRLERLLEVSLFRADSVIAVSEFTKKELIEFYQYPEEKIFVTHLGIEDIFNNRIDEKFLSAVRKKYFLNFPFILYVGTIEPRKNVSLLIRAFNIAAKKINHHLVIVGRKGWKTDKIIREAEESQFKEKIHFLGYVEESELPSIYSLADLFVFPSLYEGFGFPPLEAMKCGTPVLSSKSASLEEILKGGAYLFDLYDCDENKLAEMIIEMLENKELRAKFIIKGLSVASNYKWEYTAKKTLEVYKKVLVNEV